MPESTTPQLTESEVGEIEARANAASPSYCVDWEKGDHALLQAGGWRPANEEQPRTIANFDKDGGYLDLLFCSEARTDIPALIRDWRALRAESAEWERQARLNQQAYGREMATNAALREQLAQAENERDAALETLHGWTEAQAITNRKRAT